MKVSTSGMNLPGGRGRLLPGKRLLARGRSKSLVGVKQLIWKSKLDWGERGSMGPGSWLRFLLVHLWQPWKMEGVCMSAVSAELTDCCEDGYKMYWVRITDVVW